MEIRAVYCINMQNSMDRKVHMDAFLKKTAFTVPVYRFDGIDGSRVQNPRPKKHRPGPVGCLLSHMCLWHLIARRPEGYYVIFEDDLALVPGDEELNFQEELNSTLRSLPKRVQMLHCTLDKSRKFHYKKSRFENRYKIVGSFNGRPIKKCSLVYPWATLTGAYVITPSAARKLFLFAWYSMKLSWILPLKPKRYNVDILMSRSIIASFYGAMGIIVKTNVFVETSGRVGSVLRSVTEKGYSHEKDIYVNRNFFRKADRFLEEWRDLNEPPADT